MRRVAGPSSRVVVVGAGLAGLSAALHLAGRGREVTVVERENWPGGRAGRLDVDGYQLDTGPTVLTMPDIIDEAFAAVGENRSARLDLLTVDPAYRAQFADGSSLDVHSDADLMADTIREFAGAKQAAGYRELRDWLTRLYRTEFDGFIAENFDSPLSLLNPQLARLTALGGFRKWDTMVNRHISDPRLRRVFTFQSLYAGVAPKQALAVYAVIAYMDTISGVYFPRGGIRALPDALAAAATDAGVRFVYGATVTNLERTGSRVTAVHTDTDQRIACDAVVLTTELPTTYTLLGREPHRIGRLRPAPSAVVAHIGRRHASGVRSFTGTPQHRLRRGVGPDVHRHHPRRPADAGSVAARHQADRQRPEPGAARPRPVLRACSGAEPQPRCDRLVAARRQLHRATHRYRWGSPDSGLSRRRRGSACRQPGRLGTSGHDRRDAIRAGPHIRPDRALPSGEHVAGHRQCRAGRIVDRARRRRSHRDDLRATGRRPDHRDRGRVTANRRHESRHAMIRTEFDRCRYRRSGPARCLPALPHSQRRTRPHLLSRHPTAGT